MATLDSTHLEVKVLKTTGFRKHAVPESPKIFISYVTFFVQRFTSVSSINLPKVDLPCKHSDLPFDLPPDLPCKVSRALRDLPF